MAQLDKIFPTLDCAAYTITPKMVDTANHPNIDPLTYSEVVNVQGRAGDFTVTIRRPPKDSNLDSRDLIALYGKKLITSFLTRYGSSSLDFLKSLSTSHSPAENYFS